MSDAPNTSPAFMQTMGILGVVDLTTQVCTPSTPGTTPAIAYSTSDTYSQGNGALVEMVDLQLTGTIVATAVMMFYQLLDETSPKWRKAAMRAVAAANYDAAVELPSYKMPLKDILFPVPQNSALSNFQGLRINSTLRPIQWGFALTVAIASPVIVTLYGGEY
jgi:hypothetical protein